MFYVNEFPHTLHIELSTKCNAACPMCSRNNSGYGVNPKVQVGQLSLRDLQANLSLDFLLRLKRIIACGNFGDPIMNSELLPILIWFKEQNPKLQIELHTNGGVGSSETWKALAGLVSFCRFGIDGLEDTNHIYRRGVRWNSLMQNIEHFISAGGNAEWAYLVFKHNEHQLEMARQLSVKMGFTKFLPKRTTRNIRSDGSYLDRWPVHSDSEKIEYYLEAPQDEKFQKNIEEFKSSQKNFVSYEEYLEKTNITCKVKSERSIYLAADGSVLPCCWLGIDYTLRGNTDHSVQALIQDIDQSQEQINFKFSRIEQIAQSSIFKEIESRWTQANRIRKCAQTCGVGFDRFSNQFESK